MTLPAAFTISEAIDEAFERIQLSPEGITPQHVLSARRSIRLLLDSWNNDSVLFWKVAASQQAALVIGQASFVPVTGAIDILEMAVLRSSYYTPVDMISESDWFAIPDRDTVPQVQGMPRMCWVERLKDSVTAHFYPASENTTDIIVYNAMLQFNDSSQLAGSPDVPFRWNQAFVSGLTAFLAEKFNTPLFASKMAKYGGPGVTNARGAPPSDYQIARMGDRDRSDTIMIARKSRRWRR